jgi:hypothetical protein
LKIAVICLIKGARMLIKSCVVAAALAVVGGGVANATVIDFTSGLTGKSGALFGGAVTWEMTGSGDLSNSRAPGGAVAPGGVDLALDTAGYGVGVKDGAISTSAGSREWIEIAFSRPTLINAVYFLDLFVARKGKSTEVGLATFDEGRTVEVLGTDRVGIGASGFAAGVFEPILAKVIRFSVVRSTEANGNADGTLAGIDVATVPLPASGGLLFGALAVWSALRRRKRA